jgi:16S rRNA (guanine966-N2)-methyltransferase
VRPTSDRVRESLFARLGDLAGTRVLDLYAGTGALGIEALSRGADRAVFVERAGPSLECLRANLEQLGLCGQARVVRGDVPAAVRRLGREGQRFDVVFLDPPYASDEAPRALRALLEAGVLEPRAEVVLERSRRHPLPGVAGIVPLDERRYGDTLVTWLARRGTQDGEDGEGGAAE